MSKGRHMSHKDGRVTLSAWVDPVVRDYARAAAKGADLEFSRWVERALRRAVAQESAERAAMDAARRGECVGCGYAPCVCDQQ